MLRRTEVLACPYIGMRDDPSAFYSYPSTDNRCYHGRVPATPLTSHQMAYCLGGAQTDCPVYLQEAEGAFPRDMMVQEAPRPCSNQFSRSY